MKNQKKTQETANIFTATGNFEFCKKDTAQVLFQIKNDNDTNQVLLHYNDVVQIINYLFLNVKDKNVRKAMQDNLFSELPM